jgi:hypothetical protein
VDRGVNTNGSFQPSEKKVLADKGRQLAELASPKIDSIATSNGEFITISSGIATPGGAVIVFAKIGKTTPSPGETVGISSPKAAASKGAGS